VNKDRLSPLDASFLQIEDGSAHMHVAAALTFEGAPPPYEDLVATVEERLHLVPRYRQRVAFVPLGQGRPRWVDDPHLNIRYHVRHTALPEPGDDDQLRALAGRVFAQPLDHDKPLWELWLVEGLEDGEDGERFAVLSKTHHALVDGIAGVDLMTVLFDTQREPAVPPERGSRWLARPMPSGAQLLGESLVERAAGPLDVARALGGTIRHPRRTLGGLATGIAGVGSFLSSSVRPAPASPYNVEIGPHRRFAWVRWDLPEVKAIKDELGGTVNDVMLTVVTLALGRHLHHRGVSTDGLELRAFVPVSVRDESGRGDTGNQVAGMMAPLPVWARDPLTCHELVSEAMTGLKQSGQAIGAKALTELSGFASPTIMSQAARLAARGRFFNLVVTNVPGPQIPLYLMGHEMIEFVPMVPLAPGQAVGVAIMSYNGRIAFGLTGDWDAMPDLDDLAGDLRAAIGDLVDAAGVGRRRRAGRRSRARA
jgi:diacylglycerol O-acyltransferase / wax synthase